MNFTNSYSPSSAWSYDQDSRLFVLTNDTGEEMYSVPVDPAVTYRKGNVPFKGIFSYEKKGMIRPEDGNPSAPSCLCFFHVRDKATFHASPEAEILVVKAIPDPDSDFYNVKKIGDGFRTLRCEVGVVVALGPGGSFFAFEAGFGAMNYTFDGVKKCLRINGEKWSVPEEERIHA